MAGEQDHRVPPTMMGVVYWTDHVVAVIHDHARAEEAVAALVAEGFPADDVHAWTGVHVMERHNYYLQNRGLLQKLGALVSSEEGDVMNEFVAEAEAGHSILTVKAEDDATAQHVADVLRGYGAHDIVYYRPHTLVSL